MLRQDLDRGLLLTFHRGLVVGTEVVIDISNGLMIGRPNDCLILLLIVHASGVGHFLLQQRNQPTLPATDKLTFL